MKEGYLLHILDVLFMPSYDILLVPPVLINNTKEVLPNFGKMVVGSSFYLFNLVAFQAHVGLGCTRHSAKFYTCSEVFQMHLEMM